MCHRQIIYGHGVNNPFKTTINPLNSELNTICHLLALLAHHIFHVSRIRVKLNYI
jgi:hypothetical protein